MQRHEIATSRYTRCPFFHNLRSRMKASATTYFGRSLGSVTRTLFNVGEIYSSYLDCTWPVKLWANVVRSYGWMYKKRLHLLQSLFEHFFPNIFYSKKHVEKISKSRNSTSLTNVVSHPNNIYVACLYNYIENSDETITK